LGIWLYFAGCGDDSTANKQFDQEPNLTDICGYKATMNPRLWRQDDEYGDWR
jgi:hypothetical protein